MKWLVVVLITCVGFAAWHIHVKEVETAEAVAREQALAEARRETEARLAIEREARAREEKARLDREAAARAQEALNALAQRPLMAISKVLEPLIVQIQAPLNVQLPADLVPVVELTKQRILDKRVQAETERQPIFDRAAVAMDHLVRLAEERTDFLEALLKNRANTSTILARPTGGSTSDFFAQSTAKRWEEAVVRARPTTLQVMEQLRTAEREWNKQLDRNADTETYEVDRFQPLLIPAEQVSQSALNPAAKPAAGTPGTSTRIWRRSYYSTYGYRYPNYYYP